MAPGEDVDAEVERIALASQRPAPAVRRMMEQSGDLDSLRYSLREARTMDFLIGKAADHRLRYTTNMARRRPMGLVPMVVEQTAARRAGVRHLLPAAEGPHHLPPDHIDDEIANLVIAQLLFLEAEDPGQGHQPLHQFARAGP